MSNKEQDLKGSQLVDALSPEVDTGGRLKIFFGYAPGVGKTHEMLDECLRRKKRGQDIVIGALRAEGRPGLAEMVSVFEQVPPLRIEVQGTVVEELDVEAVKKRNPGIVLVDDLAHENAPGAPNQYRWQDVEQLLEAQISVIATVNVQSLESLKDVVAELTGIAPKESMPDRVFREADEVEMVDLTPRALLHRLRRGDLYAEGEAPPIFSEEALNGLRELALREVAGRVDVDVEQARKANRAPRPYAVTDRVMICLATEKPSMRLIRRGWRIAQRMHAEVFCVFVEEHTPTERERKIIQDDINLAERLGIETIKLSGRAREKLIYFAKEKNVTHIVLGQSTRTRMQEIVQGSLINALTRELRTVDIMIVGAESEASH